MNARDDALAGAALGGLGALLLAAGLVAVRGQVPSADIALALVVPVVLGAAVGGRTAGVVSALVATVSFDFFHTRPYGSLRIASHDEIETALTLLVVAVIVAELAARSRRTARESKSRSRELRRLHRVAELVAGNEPAEDVVSAVRAELIDILDLDDCDYEPLRTDDAVDDLPLLQPSGWVSAGPISFTAGGFELPARGVQLPVRARGREFGRFVLHPKPGVGVSLERRFVAVALSDQLGAVLAAEARERG